MTSIIPPITTIITPPSEFATNREFRITHRYIVIDDSGEFVARYTTLGCCAMTIQYRFPLGMKGASVVDAQTGERFNMPEVLATLRPGLAGVRDGQWGVM